MPHSGLGPLLVGLGLLLVLIGALVWTGAFRWFGHLPGDLRIERGPLVVFVPFGSMLVVSLLLSAVAWLLRKLF